MTQVLALGTSVSLHVLIPVPMGAPCPTLGAVGAPLYLLASYTPSLAPPAPHFWGSGQGVIQLPGQDPAPLQLTHRPPGHHTGDIPGMLSQLQ